MPIIQPASFETFNLVPFQINPHYLDANPAGHGGETRQQRIEEFLAVNRDVEVIGLREATLIQVEGEKYVLKGSRPMRIFRYGRRRWRVQSSEWPHPHKSRRGYAIVTRSHPNRHQPGGVEL